jgi:serine protease Do
LVQDLLLIQDLVWDVSHIGNFVTWTLLRVNQMNRPLGTWKLIALAIALGTPIGYWISSGTTSSGSNAYAMQLAEAQVARSGLEQNASVASADQLSKVFRDVSKSLKPSVVSIKNIVERSNVRPRGRGRSMPGLPPELEQFFGGSPFGGVPMDGFEDQSEMTGKKRVENGLGSGVIVRQDGYILTNNHVVAGASVLEVVLSDDRTFEAKVIGTDERTDLAVLKIDTTGLVTANLGNSSSMEVGDWVIAIGSPFGLAQTVTTGIVSATNRNDQGITLYDNFIQTDAAINPGNSGGPLLNLRGEVIGINTAIASRSGGYNGICFAVPSNTAKRILDDLISRGKVIRGFIGVQPATMTPAIAERFSLPSDLKGAFLVSVNKSMPAELAGLREKDVITAINGMPITSDSAMRRAIGEMKPGSVARITYFRDGKSRDVNVQVDELDEKRIADSMPVIDVFGMSVGEVSPETQQEYGLESGQGVEIKSVNRSSPFFRTLPAGVVVLSVGGKKVNSPREFEEALEAARKTGVIRMNVRDAESDKSIQFQLNR